MRKLAGLLLAMASGLAFSHGGGLDANGCHNDRKNGGYHCHRAPTRAPALPAASFAAPQAGQPIYFRNCTEARAAGYGRIKRGQPGYGPHLDRDGDGIGCE